MTDHISDDIAQIDKWTVAFLALSGAATALAGTGGLIAATAGVV
ncbi:hypothetical protein SAMN06269185_1181 [Natronoarchaeum philippinense]|uniref:Uncharacterized protein n=1 Tax=Natronoarchaeum philippinense TaxID=558529 RepID=A0A285NAK5_NATPI|nr:hypothetical protein [Natronoarchaeum philippinense]SNZ06469.1 hypothetical protein SAMN06269185_1181 [Natronoarchaeum philippinense]